MKHYQIMPRNWFLVKGIPRTVTGLRRQWVFVQNSIDYPHTLKVPISDLQPLVINKALIDSSNLRCRNNEVECIYDALRIRHATIDLPFRLKFNYDDEVPCEVIFPTGHIIRFQHIHRLQQFVNAVSGEELRIRMRI